MFCIMTRILSIGMYECMCECMCECMYICMYHDKNPLDMYVGMYVWMYVYMYMWMHVYMYVYMYVWMHVYMYVCMYVWMYVYMYDGWMDPHGHMMNGCNVMQVVHVGMGMCTAMAMGPTQQLWAVLSSTTAAVVGRAMKSNVMMVGMVMVMVMVMVDLHHPWSNGVYLTPLWP